MYVWSVAYIVDEYHPWCFINCFVEKNGGAILSLTIRLIGKPPLHTEDPMDVM
jgi:hypothetical protein